MDKVLAGQPLKVPMMLVHSLWDQEDIYGAIAVYKALEPKDTANDMVFLVMGPWHHGQEIEDGSTLGRAPVRDQHRRSTSSGNILRPFLDHYLKDDAPEGRCRARLRVRDRDEHLAAARRLARGLRRAAARSSRRRSICSPARGSASPRPKRGDAPFDEYVSDPAKPVPFRARPIQPVGYDNGLTWPRLAGRTTSARRPAGRTSWCSPPTC